ncbi:MAG: hypothetical protein WC867_07480 [Candidatus Pacearchaeota archaeon]
MEKLLRDRSLIFLIFGLFIILSINLVLAQDSSNASMIVETNFIGFSEGVSGGGISIEVPDSVFLGNITKNELVSDEITFVINNTGNVDVTVTPILKDEDEEIYKNLFFRTQKSDKDGILNISKRIGEYSIDIDKPVTGKRARSKNCYIHLNLTDFSGEIKEDLIGYKTEVIFIAMAQ